MTAAVFCIYLLHVLNARFLMELALPNHVVEGGRANRLFAPGPTKTNWGLLQQYRALFLRAGTGWDGEAQWTHPSTSNCRSMAQPRGWTYYTNHQPRHTRASCVTRLRSTSAMGADLLEIFRMLVSTWLVDSRTSPPSIHPHSLALLCLRFKPDEQHTNGEARCHDT